MLVQEFFDGEETRANYATVVANLFALAIWVLSDGPWLPDFFGRSLGFAFALPAGSRLAALPGVLVEKFRGSFCGALSAYGAFSDDSGAPFAAPVKGETVRAQLDRAAQNWMSNAFLALACAGLVRAG